ncbi:Uncharacterised protein [Mycobacterium tuberculosis]|nr:Uncharacterised protein [Mycobacterium tuberculosis]
MLDDRELKAGNPNLKATYATNYAENSFRVLQSMQTTLSQNLKLKVLPMKTVSLVKV